MKKPKTPKPEKGKTNKAESNSKELQKNVSRYDVPEMDTSKDVIESPVPPSKEQPVEKETPQKA